MPKRIIVQIPDELLVALDRRASQADRTRSWVVRDAIITALTADPLAERAAGIEWQRGNHAAAAKLADIPVQHAKLYGRHTFQPREGNALRCNECGVKKAEHP